MTYEEIYKYHLRCLKTKNNNTKKDRYRYSEMVSCPALGGMKIRIYGDGKSPEQCIQNFTKMYIQKIESPQKADENRTFETVAKEWFEAKIEKSNLSEGSKNNYRYNVKYITEGQNGCRGIGNYKIALLREKDCCDFINQFAGQGERKLDYLILTLKQILKYGNRNGYCKFTGEIEMPEFKKVSKRKSLDANFLSLFFKAYETEVDAEDFMLLLLTGIRPSEALRLKFENFDTSKMLLHIRESKTEAGIRNIPINKTVADILDKKKKRIVAQGLEPSFVFYQKSNLQKPLTIDGLGQKLNALTRKMDVLNGAKVFRNEVVSSTLGGIKRGYSSGLKYPYTPDHFRHSFATLLDDLNVRNSVIDRVIGHSLKGNVTQDSYVDKSDASLKREMEVFFSKMEECIENKEFKI